LKQKPLGKISHPVHIKSREITYIPAEKNKKLTEKSLEVYI